MKTSAKIGALIVLMIIIPFATLQKVSAQNENISLQVFYDELGQYGTWVDNPDYGYVWVPNVEPGFRPYVTNGHWVFTDYGWTWSSDYPWGWAAFHYGRWYWDEQYGNVWVPGTEWGPAWVTWRQSEGYYGWAPMAPGMSMNISFGSNYYIPADRWCFVRDRDLMRYDIGNCFIDRFRYSALIGISHLLFNVHFDAHFNHSYIYGPERGEYQRRYGRMINPIHIYDNDRPGQFLRGDRLSIYRPQFNRGRDGYNNSHPSNFSRNIDRNSYNRYSNDNNRGWNGRGSGNVVRQPAVNEPQNDRERANSWNNNNSNNRNSERSQQMNSSGYSQRDYNMNRNENRGVNNRSENVASLQNSMAYQSPREQNRFNISNESNFRRSNPQEMNQENRNNIRSDRSMQTENNNRMVSQRESRSSEVTQRNTPQRNEQVRMVTNPSRSDRKDQEERSVNHSRR
ncbi:MAG: hypothetical protein HXX14_17890 [Bacteroidetes bacterium]|nr:hypothetical protein [Bacteroidota bacterium]